MDCDVTTPSATSKPQKTSKTIKNMKKKKQFLFFLRNFLLERKGLPRATMSRTKEQQPQYGATVAGRFYECLRTMHEMLHDRGYDISTQNMPSYESVMFALRFLDLADSTRSQAIMDKYAMDVALKRDDDVRVRVYWLCGKIGVNSESMLSIQRLFEPEEDQTEEEDDAEEREEPEPQAVQTVQAAQATQTAQALPRKIILVQCEGCTITPPARKLAAKFPVVVEIFDAQDHLRRNVTHCLLQPKFTVLSQAEKEEVKRQYCASDKQLPKMKWSDVIRCYYGLRVGEVLRCTRIADGGKEVAYRIVMPAAVGKKK